MAEVTTANKRNHNRLTLVFDGKDQELYATLKQKATEDERGLNAYVLRLLRASFNPSHPQQ